MNYQRVLVTAGAAGIGREIARAFAANGAKVFVCDIDVKALDVLAQEIKGLVTNVCDISKRADIERMMAAAISALGGLDVLVSAFLLLCGKMFDGISDALSNEVEILVEGNRIVSIGRSVARPSGVEVIDL